MILRDKVIVAAVVLQAVSLGSVAAYRRAHFAMTKLPGPRRVYVTREQLADDPKQTFGNPEAPYTLVEFADYQCPPCARANSSVEQLVQKSGGKLNFCFRNFPLPSHDFAHRAAVLAEKCRGSSEFWKVHDRLYADQDQLGKAYLDAVDKAERAKSVKLSSDLDAEKRISSDMALGNVLGINGTPTFYLCTPDDKVYELASLPQASDLITK
jgi:protein-disulfide isomerase